jgi:hypothetical protein
MPFDMREPVFLQGIRVASAGNLPIDIEIRYPSDEEWSRWLKQKRFTIRQMGRGVSETIQPPPSELDVQLYEKIKLNGAPPLTPAEASRLLDRLQTCQILEVKLEGADAEVETRTSFGTITHRLKIPNADQVDAYKRSALRRLDLPHNQSHAIFSQEVAGKIYDECGGHSDDCSGGVPLPHKHDVLKAVIDDIDLEFRAKDDETF